MLFAHEIFAFMSPALALEIIEQLHQDEKDVYRAILGSVCEVRKVRPVFLEHKPRTERHKAIVESLCRPKLEPAAVTVLQTWLMKKQVAVLANFLDAMGIKHENGAVEELPKEVADETLKAAVEGLLAKHPRETVAVYLRALNDLSQANWPNLGQMLESDPRLQLGDGG
jgi:hypothetical protein